jgi:hypothetical protein
MQFHELKTKQDIVDWRDLNTRELASFYAKLRLQMPEITVPSFPRLWLKRRNPFAGAYTRSYVQRIWKRWYLYAWNPFKWIEEWIFEWANGLRFLRHLLFEDIEKKTRWAIFHGDAVPLPRRAGCHHSALNASSAFRLSSIVPIFFLMINWYEI